MNDIQKRLNEFLSVSAIPSMTEFERICRLGQGSGSKITANSYPNTFQRISSAFPELNIHWLKTGEGEMLRANVQIVNNSVGQNVYGANGNGNNVRVTCQTELSALIDIVNTHNAVVARMQSIVEATIKSINNSQRQVDELIAMIKNK